jgi:hypothetical protein
MARRGLNSISGINEVTMKASGGLIHDLYIDHV